MFEAILIPTHAYSLEPLLNEPFARTRDQSAADGQPKLFESLTLHVLAKFVQVLVQPGKNITTGFRQILYLNGSLDIAEHILGVLMAKHVPGLPKPRPSLFRHSIKTGRRRFPDVLRRMIEVQNPGSVSGKMLVVNGPESCATVTYPDHPFGCVHSLTNCPGDHPHSEHPTGSQDCNCNYPTMLPACDFLAGLGVPPSETSKNAHVHFPPIHHSGRRSAISPKRSHHCGYPNNEERQGSQPAFHALLAGLFSLSEFFKLTIKLFHGSLPRLAHPAPDACGANASLNDPLQQSCRDFKGHENNKCAGRTCFNWSFAGWYGLGYSKRFAIRNELSVSIRVHDSGHYA